MSNTWNEFVQSRIASGNAVGEGDRIRHYGDVAQEYRAIRDEVAIVARTGRVLLEVTGADRAAWLHNLTTNEVKKLTPGEGNYAFALNVQGRILFDLSMLVREAAIWIDLDRRFAELARKHFDKYTITEDVQLTDRSDEFARIGVTGPKTPELLKRIGLSQVSAMPDLGTTDLDWTGKKVTAARHDFCGQVGVELLAPSEAGAALWDCLQNSEGGIAVRAAGEEAVDMVRIEAGIPAPPWEIHDEVLPAETRQLERAVSYQKGCYLGQEVVERMRSRGVVARGLCGIKVSGDLAPSPGATVQDETGQAIGTLGSVSRSPAVGGLIALAYVKTGKDAPGAACSIADEQGAIAATMAKLPFV